jgi:hypothetical protein
MWGRLVGFCHRACRYSNLTNVVAKLSWPKSASYGVLVSAHFDSAWDSVGASDDLVQVATVLEFARALVAGPPLPVSVIFVLNGGEETMLQVRACAVCWRISAAA